MKKTAILTFLCLNMLLAQGCVSWGYQKYKPNENNEYDAMLDGLVSPFAAEKKWIWSRGKVFGDLDGDGKDEETVVATIQGGTPDVPEPITRAFLLICNRDANGKLSLRYRVNLFDAGKSLEKAPTPVGLAFPPEVLPMKDCSLQIVDSDASDRSLLLASFSSAEKDGCASAWHTAYRLDKQQGDAALKCVFSLLCWQKDAAVATMDIDKDGIDEFIIEQSVVPAASILGTHETEFPKWISVYKVGSDGVYVQADEEFRRMYRPVMLDWYKQYVSLLHAEAKNPAQSLYEYYLGRMHFYLGEFHIAERFATKSLENSSDVRITAVATDLLQKAKGAMKTE
jgi:hypothetical protein